MAKQAHMPCIVITRAGKGGAKLAEAVESYVLRKASFSNTTSEND
jgi:hypothetical protein